MGKKHTQTHSPWLVLEIDLNKIIGATIEPSTKWNEKKNQNRYETATADTKQKREREEKKMKKNW